MTNFLTLWYLIPVLYILHRISILTLFPCIAFMLVYNLFPSLHSAGCLRSLHRPEIHNVFVKFSFR